MILGIQAMPCVGIQETLCFNNQCMQHFNNKHASLFLVEVVCCQNIKKKEHFFPYHFVFAIFSHFPTMQRLPYNNHYSFFLSKKLFVSS